MTAKTYTTTNLLPSKLRAEKKRRRRIIFRIILCLAVILSAVLFFLWKYNSKNHRNLNALSGAFSEYDLSVTVVDVGQGSSAVIIADGEAMLIDTGTRDESKNVIDFLNDCKVKTLKCAVASHPHADHMGGMSDIIKSFDTERLLMSRAKNDIASYRYMMEAASVNEVEVIYPEEGDEFPLGNGTVTVLASDDTHGEGMNDRSLVLRLSYEDVSFLFMADAGTAIEELMLHGKHKKSLASDVLVVGHHGSSDASSEEFVKTVKPCEAVISCGRDNEYGHPHEKTLKTLEKYNIKVRRTDLSGNITYVYKREGELGVYGIQ